MWNDYSRRLCDPTGNASGYLSGKLYFDVENEVRIFKRAMLMFFQMGMFWIVSKGNIGAYVPDLLVMSLFFYLLSIFACLLTEFLTYEKCHLMKYHLITDK